MKIKSILITTSLFFSISFSQVIDSPKNDLKNFFKVGGDVFSSPAHFETKGWLRTTAVLGITSASFFIDKEIKEFALSNRSSFADALFKIDDIYHIEFITASIAMLYIYGVSAKDTDVRTLGLKLTEATAYSASITLFGKFLLGRKRPTNNDDPYYLSPFSTTWELMSLPSGHTTLSFAYSTVMASAYNNFFWKFGWYSLATLVGAARIYNNEHWFSDVLLGSAIGYFVGEFVNNHYTNQKEKDSLTSNGAIPNFSISFGFNF